MKKYVIAIATFAMFTFSSCDFLDLVPHSNIAVTDNFYKNDIDIQYAVTACYAALQSSNYYQSQMVLLLDVRSDDCASFGNTGGNAGREYSITNFTATGDNVIFRDVWKTMYNTISRCNNVIAHIDVVSKDNLRRQYEAEARFLRALTYFNIVRMWGKAPLLLKPITTQEATQSIRNEVADIYQAIETDLLFACDPNNLPTNFTKNIDLGRATSLAAKALLSKVYLTEKKFSKAVASLTELIQIDNVSGQGHYHSLMPDIADAFSQAPAPGSASSAYRNFPWLPQKMNAEILFAVKYTKEIPGEGRGKLSYHNNQADLNEDLKRSSKSCIYLKEDRRSDLMRSTKGTNTDDNLLVKYGDVLSSTGQYGYDTPVIRWADVLLMYAEAMNEIAYSNDVNAPAFVALNAVRTRSIPQTIAGAEYNATILSSQDKFRDAILLERRMEFPMEMNRWFDLVRTGRAIDALSKIGYTISERDLLLPVPDSEIVLRNDPVEFAQNPGY